MTEERHDRLDPEEKALVARLRQVRAVTPSPHVRSRIVDAADENRPNGRRSWWRRLPAAAIVAGVVLAVLFPPRGPRFRSGCGFIKR